LRFLWGFGLVVVLCAVIFAILAASLPNRGATPEEIAASRPGDELVAQPAILWNHAITLNATPEQIWPWLIQMGDARGGYYSYTFVENLISGECMYINADSIYPEWQDPTLGQGMIMNILVLDDYRTNSYMLAAASPEAFGIGWSWLWQLEPLDETHTRLVIRHRISPPAEMDGSTPLIGHAITLTGYVMEKGMLDGIRRRVEGEPLVSFQEGLEIFLWLVMLGAGIVAAVLFVLRVDWRLPLSLGLAALACLFLFTYVQPAIWLRSLLDALLLLLVVLAAAHKI
jgi:hypothetical protein